MLDKKKSICLILPGKLPVPNIKGGAIETLLTLLIDQNEIYERVHFIVICAWAEGIEEATSKYKNTEFYFFRIRSSIWKKGINFVNYVISKTTGSIDFFKTPMHHDIEQIIKGIQADSVVVEHGIYRHFGFLRKYFDRNQLYLHIHGIAPTMDRETKKTFGHFIAVSEYLEKIYKKDFDGYDTTFHVCLNGIADEYFRRRLSDGERQELRKQFGVNADDTLIIFCGRLIYEKGVKEIINGVIGTDNHTMKLMIVGGSNFEDSSLTKYVKEVQELAKEHSDQVFFIGYVPNNELFQYYQMADVQVVCSICEEAAGLVAIEGMMSGLPLIITDSGGLPEYVGENAYAVLKKKNALINCEDRKELSQQLTLALNNLHNSEKVNIQHVENNKYDGCSFYFHFLDIV